jgi:predicted aminopeptidase
LYIKGAGSFNESAANFVGGRAAIEFFREKFGKGSPEHQRALERWEEELEFSDFIERYAGMLKEVYGSPISEEEKLRVREEIFARAQSEWRERIAARSAPRFRAFASQPLNNAVIIHYLLYLKDLKLFEAVFEAEGRNLTRTIDAIRDAVGNGGEPFAAVRKSLG